MNQNKHRFSPLMMAICVVIGILIGTFYANHFSGNRLSIINSSSNKLSSRNRKGWIRRLPSRSCKPWSKTNKIRKRKRNAPRARNGDSRTIGKRPLIGYVSGSS